MRVLETCVYVDDLEAATHFYGIVLGLPQISYVADRHVFFRADTGVLLVFNPQATLEETVLPPHGASGPGHVAFAVAEADLGTWKHRLAAAQIPIVAEHTWPHGGSSLYVLDPAGNVVELAPPRIWGLELAEEYA